MNAKQKQLALLLLLTITAVVRLEAQTMKYLSLDSAVEAAMANNANIKIAQWDKKISNANFHQTDAIFLPQIDLSYTALSTNNPLNAFGFLLQQATVTAADFDPAKLNDPGSVQDYSAKVEVRQPIINPDMIYARKGAKKQEEIYAYKAERVKQYVEFETKKAYMQLQFSYLARNILEHSLQEVKQIHQSVHHFYTEGLLQKSDVLNAQVQVNTIESALSKAKSSIYNASNGLQVLMDDDEGMIYITDSLAQHHTAYADRILSASRADIMAMSRAIDATRMMIKSAQMGYLPKLNAFGTYQFNDAQFFGFDADSYLVGVSLSWNIFSGNQTRSKIRSYRFQKNKLQEELNLQVKQSEVEINKTKRDLYDSQVDIDKHTASVMQAEESLRITRNRHQEGLVNTTDLLTAQAQLSQQRLLLAQAVLSYNITLAYLQFLTENN